MSSSKIDRDEVGAFATLGADGRFSLRFGFYLPGVKKTDGFSLLVKVIHELDRFDPRVPAQNRALDWVSGHALDLWTVTFPVPSIPGTHFGEDGRYLYRFQLQWNTPGAQPQLITEWCTDPFASATDVGRLAAIVLDRNAKPWVWTDAAYTTPALDDLIVYEMQVGEFNQTFAGATDRLTYLKSLGVNCLELMPVMSSKLDFDWGYGPLHFFAPSSRYGGGEQLKALVDAAHAHGIAVILDVVYEHVDEMFPYFRIYDDISKSSSPAKPPNPMIRGRNIYGFGPTPDFTLDFTCDYFVNANNMWLDTYHVDGFRYDEVSDWYSGASGPGYKWLVEQTYLYSRSLLRFAAGPGKPSRIIQCAEGLGQARRVLVETYTNCTWQDELLGKAEDMIRWNYASVDFAHSLDPVFTGFAITKTVADTNNHDVEMPVAPFQYLESHDHNPLITCAGTKGDGSLPEGDRDKFYLTQPYLIALYTCQGIPMLYQGQEFADNYNLPDKGDGRIHLRRDVRWEYFYDSPGQSLVRLCRILGQMRRTYSCLRSRSSYYYYQQSLQGNKVIAYRRTAPAANGASEQSAMVFINFGDAAVTVTVPFPKSGTWVELIDADQREWKLTVAHDGDNQTISVPSNYGVVFLQSV